MSWETACPSSWAVLIGVGVNVDGTKRDGESSVRDQSLRGPPQDAIAMNEYFATASRPVDITVLTATKSSYDDISGVPTEDPELLPTFDNVCSSFKRVIELGKPKDRVYIHYSGHGTRRAVDGAVALVLFDHCLLGKRYLYGSILCSALNRMVEKGMFVTLVLDCCFSGSVLRMNKLHGASIRFVEHDTTVDEQSENVNPFGHDSTSGSRGSEIKLDRLLDPKSYTILSACGPHEEASEIRFEGGACRGALSYFLLDSLVSLRRRGVQVTVQALHQHIRARFHARYPHQSPMLYGYETFSFFGDIMIRVGEPLVSMYKELDGGHLILSAGQAHGVHQEDEYIAYPFHTSETVVNTASPSSVKVKVDRVNCLTSNLIMIDPSQADQVEKDSSWKAKLLTSLTTKKVRIRLMPCVPESKRIVQSALQYPYLHLCTGAEESDAPTFQVAINDQSVYEVRDGFSRKVLGLPAIPLDTVGGCSAIAGLLGHMAAFKYFEEIQNQLPNPTFEMSFSLDCDYAPGQDGYREVQHGKELAIRFKNLDKQPKYLALFSFNSFWGIDDLVSVAGEGDFLVVPPKSHQDPGEVTIPLKMTVETQGQGPQRTEDVLKAFITSKPTAFPALILPRVGDDGLRGDPDQVAKLVGSLISSFGGMRDDDSGNWSTETFFVRTSSP
jgi:hypothetical protein